MATFQTCKHSLHRASGHINLYKFKGICKQYVVRIIHCNQTFQCHTPAHPPQHSNPLVDMTFECYTLLRLFGWRLMLLQNPLKFLLSNHGVAATAAPLFSIPKVWTSYGSRIQCIENESRHLGLSSIQIDITVDFCKEVSQVF